MLEHVVTADDTAHPGFILHYDAPILITRQFSRDHSADDVRRRTRRRRHNNADHAGRERVSCCRHRHICKRPKSRDEAHKRVGKKYFYALAHSWTPSKASHCIARTAATFE